MKKRADGRYCKQIMLGYKPNGRRNIVSVYGKTKREVESKEREVLSSIEGGVYIPKGDTFGEWLTDWIEIYKSDTSVNTLSMYRNAIDKHLIPMLGKIYLSELKSTQLQKALNAIAEEKPRIAQICRLTIKQAIKQAVADGLMPKDVSTMLKPIKKETDPKKPLSHEEIVSLESADLTEQEHLFISLLRYTGFRRGEALALTKDDFDFSEKTVRVNKSLMIDKNNSYIKEPKTKASNRVVPLPSFIISAFETYIASLSGDIVFPMKNNSYRTLSSFRRFWEGIVKKASAAANELYLSGHLEYEGVGSDITPHRFRHTYATNLYYAGVDIKTAQYLLGHSTIQMTLQTYTHLDSLKISNETAKIEAFFSSENQSKISQACNY